MVTELENSLRNVAATIATLVQNAATLQVETQYVQLEAGPAGSSDVGFDQARPIARTVLKFDGDSTVIVPMQMQAGVFQVDATLLDLHQRNVAAAIEYRAKILSALLAALPLQRR